MSVQEDVRKKHETEFLHLYYDMLEKRGAFSKSSETHAAKSNSSKTDEFTFDACYHKYLIGVATSSAIPVLHARDLIESKKCIEKNSDNSELADKDKLQIAMHDSIPNKVFPLFPLFFSFQLFY
jgi:hypothetical protein